MANESSRRGSYIVRIGLLVFAVVMFFVFVSLIREFNARTAEKAALLGKRDELKLNVEYLSNMLESSDDKEFIEKAARERLGYVYDGDHVYIDISGD